MSASGTRLAIITAGALGLVLAASPVRAERRAVYSIHAADGSAAEGRIRRQLEALGGVANVDFNLGKAELYVRMADELTDAMILEAIERAGYQASVGAGKGSYVPLPPYPDGLDAKTLSRHGEAVGDLAALSVKGKYTLFFAYAEWSSASRQLDARLREVLQRRNDVALRRLNVVDLDSPLAHELSGLDELPYLVVIGPTGERRSLAGASADELDALLRSR